MSMNKLRRILSSILSIVFIFVSVFIVNISLITENVYAAVNAYSRIEAENYDSKTGDNITIFGISGQNGKAIGYIEPGYTVTYNNLDFGYGTISFIARVASDKDISFQIKSGNTVLGTFNIPNTGSFDTYETRSCNINNINGMHDICFVFNGPVNFDWFSFTPASLTRSAFSQIEAESFSSINGNYMQIIDTPGGNALGFVLDNDYASYYNLDFESGVTSFTAMVSTDSSATIQIRSGSQYGTVLGTLNITSTGSFDTYKTFSCNISNITGVNNIYIVFYGFVNIDWFTFSAANIPTQNPTPTQTSTVSSKSAFSQIEAESFNEIHGQYIKIIEAPSGYAIGYVLDNDYIEFYNLDFGSGSSLFKATVAAASGDDTSIEVRLGNSIGPLLGRLSVSSTGSWDTYVEQTCSISSITGINNICLVFKGFVNLDKFTFVAANTPTPTTTISPTPVSIRSAFSEIQAESLNSLSSANIQAFSITGGTAIGYIEKDNYIVFNNLDFGSGASSFKARVATEKTVSNIYIKKGSPTGMTIGTLSVASTGNWSNYQVMTCSVSNISGVNDIYFVFSDAINIDWFMFSPNSATPAPTINAFATIQAENYSNISSTNIKTIDITVGSAIGYIQTDNYIVFNNVNFGTNAKSFKMRAACASGSTTNIQIKIDNSTGTVIGTLSVPSSEDWDAYHEITCSISGVTDVHDLYLVFSGPVNIDWLIFSTAVVTSTPIPTNTLTPSPAPNVTTSISSSPILTPTPTITYDPVATSIMDQSGFKLTRPALPTAEIASINTLSAIQDGELIVDGIGTLQSSGKRDVVLLVDNSAATSTVVMDVVSPLDFVLFANRNIFGQGDKASVYGSAVANNKFKSDIPDLSVTGTASASSFELCYGTNIENKQILTSPIAMPEFSNKLIDEAYATEIEDTTVSPTQKIHWVFEPNAKYYNNPDFPGQPGFKIRYEEDTNTFVITGAGTFNLTSSMYFKGNVRISVPNIINTGSSFIVADGFVELQGQSLNTSELDENDINNNTNLLNVYSRHSYIWVQTSNARIYGILYAAGIPNELYPKDPSNADLDVGNIVFIGQSNYIYGSVVAGKDIITRGGDTKFYCTPIVNSKAEIKYIRTATPLSSIGAAKQIVEAFKGKATNMCALQYSDKVNSTNLTFYDLNDPSQVSILENDVIGAFVPNENGLSNMGDALRRAYYLLSDPAYSTSPDKYIIILAANAPNKWTSNGDTPPTMKTTPGVVDESSIFGDGTIDSDGSALNYAINIAGMIKSSGINTIFIDNSAKDISANINKIALAAGAMKDSTTNKNHFTTTSLPNFSTIYKTVFLDPPDTAILKIYEYYEVFPEGIKVESVEVEGVDLKYVDVEDVDADKDAYYQFGKTENGRYYVRVKGVIIQLKYDGTKYKVHESTINIKVRPTKVGTIEFKGNDAKFTYKIDYIDLNGEYKSTYFVKNLDDYTFAVKMTIDIV
jgi:hypothetical protein